jgi:hypothetical protein
MGDPPRLPRRVRPRTTTTFRPEFTLFVLYLFAFFVFFALLLALPDLIEGARALPPDPGPLREEERARAAQIARDALRGRLGYAFAAAVVALALGARARVLPGLRKRR